MSIEWPAAAVIAQIHKCTYYSQFYIVSDHAIHKEYSCGDTVIVKLNHKTLVAEITHLWLFNSNSNGHVRLRLYCRPDDLPHGRTHHHGEHEILMFYKPTVLTCKKLLSIEQQHYNWSFGVPLQHPPPPPLLSSESSIDHLYCNEAMVTVGGFQDGTGVSPASSPVLSRCPLNLTTKPLSYKLNIISFPAYCRYRAVLKRFHPNSYSYMSYPLVQAMGGIPLPLVPTVALFCRKTFRDMTLERRIVMLEEGVLSDPCKEIFQPSLNDKVNPPKRKRGRPRKAEQVTPPSPTLTQTIKRKRGRPRKYPRPVTADEKDHSLQIMTNAVSPTDIESPPLLPTQQPLMQYNNSNSTELMSDATNSSDEIISQSSQSSPIESPMCEGKPHSLRPRDTLQPPTQFRDDSIYDTKLHLSDSLIVEREPKKSVTIQQLKSEKEICHYKMNVCIDETPPTPPPLPPPPPPPVISPDVRQLLKAHLLQDNESQAMLQNLDEHLLEEKPFLDLLFCFMRLRNTPIHKIPRLGSKYLSLYDLFHSTSKMGGYDQVTVNRKWSSVFDSMGCSSGMTCASTVTRKHYEKLLLPFEKALAAMRQATRKTE